MKGIVVKYDADKRFGFIRSEQHEKDLFVHINSVTNASDLSPGQAVEFEVENTAKGMNAVSVVAGKKQRSPFILFGAVSAFIIILVAGYLYLGQELHLFLAYLVAVNLTTLIMYGYDKTIAGSGKLRIPEWVLHSLAIIGGSPTALAAQKLFRHKTIKKSFQLTYWAIVFIQVVGIIWLVSRT